MNISLPLSPFSHTPPPPPPLALPTGVGTDRNDSHNHRDNITDGDADDGREGNV